MDVENDPYLTDFFNVRGFRPNTIRVIKQVMKQYCQFIGKTPTELIKEARQEQIDNIWKTDRKVRQYLSSFINKMEADNKAPKTIETYMGHVKSFYIEHEIDLPRVRVKRAHDQNQTTSDIPSKDDITQALKFANIKFRAIIMLMASSGMASADIRERTVEDFYVSLGLEPEFPIDFKELKSFIKEKKNYCPIWQHNRRKSGVQFTTFSTPESLRAIVDFMRTVNKKYNSLDDKLFLFDSNYGGGNLERHFRRINDRAGFGWKGNSRFFTSHKLRKYFTSTLYANRVPQLSIEWYLGHKIPRTTNSYFKANVKTHRKEYERMVPDLTFTENVKTIILESEELTKLKKEYEDGFKEKEEEIIALKKEMKLIKKLISDKEFVADSGKTN